MHHTLPTSLPTTKQTNQPNQRNTNPPQASPFFGFALRVLGAIGASNWLAYLRLLHGAPCLLASAAAIHLANMRSAALKTLLATGDKVADPSSATGRTTGVPLARFARALQFNTMDQARAFALAHGDLVTLRAGGGGELWVVRGVNPATGLLRNWKVPKLLPRYSEAWLSAKVPGGNPSDLVLNPCTPPDLAVFGSDSVAAAAASERAAAAARLARAPAWATTRAASPLPACSPSPGEAAEAQQIRKPGALYAPPIPAHPSSSSQQQQQQQSPAAAGRTSSGLLSKVTTFIFGGGSGTPAQQQQQQGQQQPPSRLGAQPVQAAAAAAQGFGAGGTAGFGASPAAAARSAAGDASAQAQAQAAAAAAAMAAAQVAQDAQAQRIAAQQMAAAQQAVAAANAQAAALQQQLEMERRRAAAVAAELEAVQRRQWEAEARLRAEAARAEEERRQESSNVSLGWKELGDWGAGWVVIGCLL